MVAVLPALLQPVLHPPGVAGRVWLGQGTDRALLDSCARFARVSGGSYGGIRLEGIRRPDILIYEVWGSAT